MNLAANRPMKFLSTQQEVPQLELRGGAEKLPDRSKRNLQLRANAPLQPVRGAEILLVVHFPVINCVQQHRHWLPDETETYPKYHVPHRAPRIPSVYRLRQEYQRHLSHHGQEAVHAHHVTRHAYQHLVHDGRYKEYHEGGARLREAHSDGREVGMADEPVVDRHVPKPPVRADLGGVPPILVENPIAEPKQFRRQVEEAVKESVKSQQPNVRRRDRQLQQVVADDLSPNHPPVGLQVSHQAVQIRSDDLRREERHERR
mmetsp:Transcript_28426/g.60205  ORF Transcript_28426/g.60205 Transcript_28426/m.60205 type:complete len:259 (-) Transcript_28426:1781-2557(-)